VNGYVSGLLTTTIRIPVKVYALTDETRRAIGQQEMQATGVHTPGRHLPRVCAVETTHSISGIAGLSRDQTVFHVIRIRFAAVWCAGIVEHGCCSGGEPGHGPRTTQVMLVHAGAEFVDGNRC
jgi:hypothetical protein